MPTFPRAPGFPPAPGTENFPPAVPGGGGLGGIGPRSVSFTRQQPGRPMTLDALMQRRKEAAARQAEALQTPQTTIPGGIGQMITAFTQGLRQSRAEQEEQRGHDVIADVFSKMDPATGATAEQMAAIGQYDPDMMIKLWSDRATRLAEAAKQEKWEPVPGHPEIQRNTVTGETKKSEMGGAADVKLSDLGTLRDDYVKSATLYDNASPTWQSMQDAAATALSTDATKEGKGAADYNMIVGFAKLLDPNSVVREGEVKSASMTGGQLEQLQGWLNQLTSQGMLSDPVRRAIMTEGNSRVKAYYDQAKTKRDWLTGVATRHGINPDDIAAPLPEMTQWGQEPAAGITMDVIEALPRLPNGDPDLSKLPPEQKAILKQMTVEQLQKLGLIQS